MVPPVQSLDPLTLANVMDVAFIETQLFRLNGSDFGIDIGQQFNPNTQSLNDSLVERLSEGGGSGCHKPGRE